MLLLGVIGRSYYTIDIGNENTLRTTTTSSEKCCASPHFATNEQDLGAFWKGLGWTMLKVNYCALAGD